MDTSEQTKNIKKKRKKRNIFFQTFLIQNFKSKSLIITKQKIKHITKQMNFILVLNAAFHEKKTVKIYLKIKSN